MRRTMRANRLFTIFHDDAIDVSRRKSFQLFNKIFLLEFDEIQYVNSMRRTVNTSNVQNDLLCAIPVGDDAIQCVSRLPIFHETKISIFGNYPK